ncbi:MAG: hypothetical protein JXR96_30530 [Deltaproteobacteria bacterium]|nr:hypothetical protein [Deltaproteobacteria bacterium]
MVAGTAASGDPERLVGAWRLVEQRAVDGEPLSFHVTYKEYTFRADGRFDLRAHVECLDGGAWSLAGRELTLLRPPHGLSGEMAEYAPPPLLRKVRVAELGADRLVLEEPQPEVYGTPPRVVRNTFRRVRPGDFGPMLGAAVATTAVTAGEYAAAFQYETTKYPTMEIYVSHGVVGRARLVLAAGGAVSGCLAASVGQHSSTSKYASPDGEHHSASHENRWLMGVRGSWRALPDGGAAVTLDELYQGGCDVSGAPDAASAPIELACQALRPTERLPVTTLACRLVEAPHWMRELALNPADTVRAGPYTMQSDPMGRIEAPLGRPWLLLGAAPGLQVRSIDGRDDMSPRVSFEAGEVTIEEHRFRPHAQR